MRWRTGRRPKARPGKALQRGLSDGRRRLAFVAGVSAVLLTSIAGAASAGVFTGRGQASGSITGHLPSLASAPSGLASAADRQGSRVRPNRPADRTFCSSVGHVGDSTSVGMVSRESLPNPAQRLAAQYNDVGVRRVRIDASGGRSIVEQLPGQLDGYQVASGWYQAGFRGCFVFALGTNDTANVSVGSPTGLAARIQEMMSAAHGEPVMWVTVQTDLSTGPWSQANMQLWNNALIAACKAYPNMRIFNWAAMVRPGWYLKDGVHYTSAGYAIRAHAIALALAKAFPANRHDRSCVLR